MHLVQLLEISVMSLQSSLICNHQHVGIIRLLASATFNLHYTTLASTPGGQPAKLGCVYLAMKAMHIEQWSLPAMEALHDAGHGHGAASFATYIKNP